MKPTIEKIRKLVDAMPGTACKGILLDALAKCDREGGITTADSGGGSGGNPPTPPNPPK